MKTIIQFYTQLSYVQVVLLVLMFGMIICLIALLVRSIYFRIFKNKRSEFNRRYGRSL